MPADRSRRRLRAAVVAAAVVASALGLVPRPVVGRTAPKVVGREHRVALASLVPATASPVRLSTGGVTVREETRTRPETICSEIVFTMVGIVWRQSGDTETEARIAWGPDAGALGRTVEVEADPAEAPDADPAERGALVGTTPLWTGEARCVRFSLRLPADERLTGLRLSFINTNGTAHADTPLERLRSAVVEAFGSLAGGWAPESAAALARRPDIVTRQEWKADEDWRNCGPYYADAVKMAFVHHTAGSNDYTRAEAAGVVRGIYYYHTHSRGFCDIAYNFLVDRFGRIYEGRYGGMARPVIGGHATGFNTGSVGVAAMGIFTDVGPPRRMVSAFKRLLAWRLDVAFVRPTARVWMTSAGGSATRYEEGDRVRLAAISGHRDTGYTECPGARLYRRLDDIRSGALAIGLPKMWNPRQSRRRFEPVAEAVRWTATLSTSMKWTIRVRDEAGTIVRTFAGKGDRIDQSWRGRSGVGVPVPPGDYTVRIHANKRDGGETRAKRFRLVVVASVPT